MDLKKNTHVTLRTVKFNVSEPKEYFINPNCFGDDFANWLMVKLTDQNIVVEKDGPDQEDFGWYVNFTVDDDEITCVIVYSESDEKWFLILEYNVGIIGTILGRRNKHVANNVVNVLDEILKAEPEFYSVEWYR